MFHLGRLFRFLPLLVGLSLLFTFGGTVSAAALTSQHQSMPKTSSTTLRGAPGTTPQVRLSITSNCDEGSIAYGSNGGVRCAVASYATPCLNIHNINNFNSFACVAPGTVLELMCQVDIPSQTHLGNSWWDAGYLSDGRFGEFSDAYMDTAWTNNAGSPTLGLCATG